MQAADTKTKTTGNAATEEPQDTTVNRGQEEEERTLVEKNHNADDLSREVSGGIDAKVSAQMSDEDTACEIWYFTQRIEN